MTGFPVIRRTHLEILQVNLGYRCNQRCIHCHVNAGPERTEMMDRATIDQVIAFLASPNLRQLDLTGGAPEMNPHFRHLIRSARAMGLNVIDRCNLTVLEEPGMEGLEEFLADQKVEIIASLPCYLKENVDHQRGNGVFEASLRALKKLNEGIKREERKWGRFDVNLSGKHPFLRLIEFLMNWRSRLSHIATGDQAIFVNRELFEAIGGFPEIDLMEDIALSKMLKKHGRPLCLYQRVLTSSRRWEEKGFPRTVLLMWFLRLAYFIKVNPNRLAKFYYPKIE